jgi:hypothetical protein
LCAPVCPADDEDDDNAASFIASGLDTATAPSCIGLAELADDELSEYASDSCLASPPAAGATAQHRPSPTPGMPRSRQLTTLEMTAPISWHAMPTDAMMPP